MELERTNPIYMLGWTQQNIEKIKSMPKEKVESFYTLIKNAEAQAPADWKEKLEEYKKSAGTDMFTEMPDLKHFTNTNTPKVESVVPTEQQESEKESVVARKRTRRKAPVVTQEEVTQDIPSF